jgi:hypothetical protein
VAGACAWVTVTSKLFDVELPELSFAVHSTFVLPSGNVEPEAGLQVVDGFGSTVSDAFTE